MRVEVGVALFIAQQWSMSSLSARPALASSHPEMRGVLLMSSGGGSPASSCGLE